MTRTVAIQIIAWSALVALAVMTVGPIGLRPNLMVTVQIERAAAFFVVGFLFAVAYPRQFWLVALMLAFSIAALEMAQHLRADRHGEVFDAVAKFIGATLGMLIGRTSASILSRQARRRS